MRQACACLTFRHCRPRCVLGLWLMCCPLRSLIPTCLMNADGRTRTLLWPRLHPAAHGGQMHFDIHLLMRFDSSCGKIRFDVHLWAMVASAREGQDAFRLASFPTPRCRAFAVAKEERASALCASALCGCQASTRVCAGRPTHRNAGRTCSPVPEHALTGFGPHPPSLRVERHTFEHFHACWVHHSLSPVCSLES